MRHRFVPFLLAAGLGLALGCSRESVLQKSGSSSAGPTFELEMPADTQLTARLHADLNDRQMPWPGLMVVVPAPQKGPRVISLSVEFLDPSGQGEPPWGDGTVRLSAGIPGKSSGFARELAPYLPFSPTQGRSTATSSGSRRLAVGQAWQKVWSMVLEGKVAPEGKAYTAQKVAYHLTAKLTPLPEGGEREIRFYDGEGNSLSQP